MADSLARIARSWLRAKHNRPFLASKVTVSLSHSVTLESLVDGRHANSPSIEYYGANSVKSFTLPRKDQMHPLS